MRICAAETLNSLTDIETILIVDVETTGLKKDSEIIQFSAIGYHLFPNGSIREEERINYYINPKQKVPIQVQKLTGLDDHFLSRMEYEETVFPLIHQFLCRNQEALLAGYCVDFDIRMIRSMYLRQNMDFPEYVFLDEKKMAKDILLPDGLEQYIGTHSPSSAK